MGGEPLVSLTNRTVTAGSRILVEGLSLTVRSNEYWAILGPNGSGKSATAKQLFYRLLAGESTQIGSTSVAGGTAGLGSYVSFERQRRLLHLEAREFSQSRFESRHKRASVASFLFPELYPRYPDDIEYGWRPPRTRLTPLPVPYDADSDHPLLAQLEAAACSGNAGRLLRAFNLLWKLRSWLRDAHMPAAWRSTSALPPCLEQNQPLETAMPRLLADPSVSSARSSSSGRCTCRTARRRCSTGYHGPYMQVRSG